MKPYLIIPPRKIHPPDKPQDPTKPVFPKQAHISPVIKQFNQCDTDVLELIKLPRPKISPSHVNWSPIPLTEKNEVVSYVYGRCAFNDIARALDTATNSEHRIYLAGWSIENNVQLRDPKIALPGVLTLLEQFLRNTKAQIRALLWNSPPFAYKDADNRPIVNLINSLPHGAALLDGRLPLEPMGVHHQKILIVSGRLGLIAFTGGMDLHNTRVNVNGSQPLHDVHMRLRGPAAKLLLKVFQERWQDHPDTVALDKKLGILPGSLYGARADVAFPLSLPRAQLVSSSIFPTGIKPREDRLVAIGCTYADLNKTKNSPSYSFAFRGNFSAWQMIEHAIKAAKKWIYLEDQYLSSSLVRDMLAKKLTEKEFKFLLILVCRDDIVDFPFATIWHNEYRAAFLKADPMQKKWSINTLVDLNNSPTNSSRRPWCGSYVHSKTWIFDDEYAIVGTANCTDRSLTHDSEVVVGVADNPLNSTRGEGFARQLRISLWRKHLGVPHNLVRDYTAGLKLWLKPSSTAMIYPYSKLRTPRPYNLTLSPETTINIDPNEVDVQKLRQFIDPNSMK